MDDVVFPSPKPPHVPRIPPPKDGRKKVILHLSDFHIDTLYSVGASNACGYPICCRAEYGQGHGNTSAGRWGDYHCDVNLEMVHYMLNDLTKVKGIRPDYVFWTGDNEPHDVWKQTRETGVNSTLLVTNLIKQYFPDSQVFPSLGNHEGVPVNIVPLPYQTDGHWLYDALLGSWSDWIDTQALASFQYAGYYTMPMRGIDKGRVISLNTNWCEELNFQIIGQPIDASGMLKWLIDTLDAAEKAMEKVYIIGHIPSGQVDCIEPWSRRFYQIVDRYEDTIVSLFYGHEHTDSITMYHAVDGSGRPTAMAYVSPSVTTCSNLNPSYRIYTIDELSKYVVESSTYHADIALANKLGEPHWVLGYNATSAYDMTNLFPEDWEAFAQRMVSNSTLLESYYLNFYAKSPYAYDHPSML
eukprot:gene4085-4761_t